MTAAREGYLLQQENQGQNKAMVCLQLKLHHSLKLKVFYESKTILRPYHYLRPYLYLYQFLHS